MLSDNIFFYGIKAEILFGVCQRRSWMGKAVETVFLRVVLPAVMEIIVQERASYHTLFVASKSQFVGKLAADVGHRKGMSEPVGVSVLCIFRKTLYRPLFNGASGSPDKLF